MLGTGEEKSKIIMERNLSKLVDYTIPGDEQCLVISGSTSRLYTRYDPPMGFYHQKLVMRWLYIDLKVILVGQT